MKAIPCLRRFTLAALLAVLGAAALTSATAAEKIKLATLAPTGSTYQKSLLAMKDAWRKASNGGVDLIVYADGKLGGEADTVGLMGVNSLQAAMLTGVGLAEIERAVTGLQCMPMGFRDFSEVDYVTEKMRPMLEKRMEDFAGCAGLLGEQQRLLDLSQDLGLPHDHRVEAGRHREKVPDGF